MSSTSVMERNRVVGIVSKLPKIREPAEGDSSRKRVIWPENQTANLTRIIQELDGGKLRKLLNEPTNVQVNLFLTEKSKI